MVRSLEVTSTRMQAKRRSTTRSPLPVSMVAGRRTPKPSWNSRPAPLRRAPTTPRTAHLSASTVTNKRSARARSWRRLARGRLNYLWCCEVDTIVVSGHVLRRPERFWAADKRCGEMHGFRVAPECRNHEAECCRTARGAIWSAARPTTVHIIRGAFGRSLEPFFVAPRVGLDVDDTAMLGERSTGAP